MSVVQQEAVKADNVKQSGWGRPQLAYSVSKALINAFTVVLGKESEGQTVVNACCPG
jgi:NAD(P)-dependent dehydrogenase (short-subunit alcohol dehydrogenase family)